MKEYEGEGMEVKCLVEYNTGFPVFKKMRTVTLPASDIAVLPDGRRWSFSSFLAGEVVALIHGPRFSIEEEA